jgi:hypothetical protein
VVKEPKKAESTRIQKENSPSTKRIKKSCRSERVVRFHDDLEHEGGESSSSNFSNEYGNKSEAKNMSTERSTERKSPGFFNSLFNFNQKFEESSSRSNQNK